MALLLFFISGVAIMYISSRKLIRERLSTETELAANLLDDTSDFEKFEAYYNNGELRVTVIDVASGAVLFESDIKSDEDMENHLDREEVQKALQDTPKAVERYSNTLKCKMTYYAVKHTLADGTEIVLRLAVRSSEISYYVFTALPFFFLSLLVTMIVASGLARQLSAGVSEKITQVGDCLKSLNAGEYLPLETNTSEPEFYSVFNEINELNESTHEYIRRQESARQRLNAVLDNVAQGIIAVNENCEIVFVNGSALRMFDGTTADEGKKLNYLIESSGLCEAIAARLGEREFTFEYPYDDKTLAVTGKKTEGTDENGLSDILIFTDITAEKEMLRQKSDFFANASHELKTPITVMRGLTEILLEKENLDEQEKKQISRIHKESIRMTGLISDMLKLSKLERGNDEEERTEVDLRETALEIVTELAEEAKAKNLMVTVTGEGKVHADPKKIFELVQNLCSNAVNYNKQDGNIRITVTEGVDTVTLEVADSGIGIEKEHLPRLCERFYRVDKSRSKKTGGTGLGLAIVKHICALYKAELSIDSKIDEGTCVTVRFQK